MILISILIGGEGVAIEFTFVGASKAYKKVNREKTMSN
jgi:hypothetical protein